MDIIIGAIMVPPPPRVDGPSYAKEGGVEGFLICLTWIIFIAVMLYCIYNDRK